MIHGLTNLALRSINNGKLTEAIKIYKNLAELEPQEASHAYIALILDKTSINGKNIIDAIEFPRKCKAVTKRITVPTTIIQSFSKKL